VSPGEFCADTGIAKTLDRLEIKTFGGLTLPGLVYVRVTVHDVERHSAVETARMHLDTVLAVTGVHEHVWKVLGGYLFFDDSPWNPFGARWGLKEPLPEPVFYQNDHFATDLGNMTANGHVITADTAQRMQPPLRLLSALTDTARADSEAVAMAAVRAIEHSNTWIAPTGGLHWNAGACTTSASAASTTEPAS
jgi:hypothetical protein